MGRYLRVGDAHVAVSSWEYGCGAGWGQGVACSVAIAQGAASSRSISSPTGRRWLRAMPGDGDRGGGMREADALGERTRLRQRHRQCAIEDVAGSNGIDWRDGEAGYQRAHGAGGHERAAAPQGDDDRVRPAFEQQRGALGGASSSIAHPGQQFRFGLIGGDDRPWQPGSWSSGARWRRIEDRPRAARTRDGEGMAHGLQAGLRAAAAGWPPPLIAALPRSMSAGRRRSLAPGATAMQFSAWAIDEDQRNPRWRLLIA
jgi:hypothetical protein